MATEAIPDARLEAMRCLDGAMKAIEAGCIHQAESRTLTALAWLRDVITSGNSLDDLAVSPQPSPGWEYRP